MNRVCFRRVSSCCTVAAAGVCALLLAPAALAFTVPEPGLWETRTQTTYNGVDLLAEMRKNVEAQLQQMNPQQRTQMGPMLQEMRDNLSGVDKECITAEDAAKARTPQAVVDEMNKEDDSGCRFSLVEDRGDTLRIRGDCKATPGQGGFVGTIQGEMKASGPRAWSMVYRGTGRMVVPEDAMLPPEVKGKLAGPVQFEMKSSGRWLGPQCGAVKP
ncbi:MAG: DUF3617 domain-containing protein [Thiomonas sp.]